MTLIIIHLTCRRKKERERGENKKEEVRTRQEKEREVKERTRLRQMRVERKTGGNGIKRKRGIRKRIKRWKKQKKHDLKRPGGIYMLKSELRYIQTEA